MISLNINNFLIVLSVLLFLQSTHSALSEQKKKSYGPTSTSSFFKDKTKEYGLENVQGERFFAVDFNNDTYTDLVILPSNYAIPVFYRFDKKEKKFLKLNYFPFPNSIRASFLVFHDFDKDGILDVIVGVFNQRIELMQYPLRIFKGNFNKEKLTYNPVSFKSDPLPTSSVVLLDYDLDGSIDFFQGNYFKLENKQNRSSPDRLWQGKGIAFKNQSILLKKEHDYDKKFKFYKNAMPTTGVSICDVDLNGYPDILTASAGGNENKMWLNLYDNKNESRVFENYGRISGVAEDGKETFLKYSGGNTFFTICADYNNNGIIDMAVGELKYAHDPPSRDISSILSGTEKQFPPKFIRTPYTHNEKKDVKTWSQADRRGIFSDINFDGLIDLVIDHSGLPPTSRLVYFKQQNDHSFTDEAKEHSLDILNPAGTITLDVNRDGKLDLLVGQTNVRDVSIPKKVFLMINTMSRNKKRSIRFYLHGKKSNVQGIGARLVLKTNRRKMQQIVQYSFGESPSQLEQGTYFGIGEDHLQSIDVTWPFLDKKKEERPSFLVATYNLSKLRFTKHLNITLCEDGRLFHGIKRCF